jgi:protein gp37
VTHTNVESIVFAARRLPVKFVSLEPLLGPLNNLDLEDINWAIVGGESGPNARPMHVEWVRAIRDQCLKQSVAFHFKQWGGTNKKRTGRLLDGRVWNEWPHQGTRSSFEPASAAQCRISLSWTCAMAL